MEKYLSDPLNPNSCASEMISIFKVFTSPESLWWPNSLRQLQIQLGPTPFHRWRFCRRPETYQGWDQICQNNFSLTESYASKHSFVPQRAGKGLKGSTKVEHHSVVKENDLLVLEDTIWRGLSWQGSGQVGKALWLACPIEAHCDCNSFQRSKAHLNLTKDYSARLQHLLEAWDWQISLQWPSTLALCTKPAGFL